MARLPKSLAKRDQSLFELPSKVDTQRIYCGDNLEVLRRMPAGCVDLIYIDPPFNSNRNYEVFWGETKEKRAFEDRHESTRAYIEFMRPRCVEMARVLKKTGSFYYHCDWHASHYVKVMLDQIFAESSFRNELVWKRASTVKGNFGQGSRMWSPNTDSIFFYTPTNQNTFNQIFKPYTQDYLDTFYRHVDKNGRRYRLISMIGPGGGAKGNPRYECMGVTKYWRYSEKTMNKLIEEGMVVQSKPGAVPQRKQFLDKGKGVAIQTLWDDIEALSPSARERLGYPTQKPLALLDRIISASSKPGDIVLDAFCGCGTALASAQNLGRRWIGIDVSPTACRVIESRLTDDCKLVLGRDFYVIGLPRDEKQLRTMPPFEFENWAVVALGGVPNKAKVGDMGIDGRIYPVSSIDEQTKKQPGHFDFMDLWYPVQVKQQDKVGRPDIDKFEAVMTRENRRKGFFVAFDYTRDALQEAESFFKKQNRLIVPLTVKKILEDEAELVRILF